MKEKYSLGQMDGKQKDNKEDASENLGKKFSVVENCNSNILFVIVISFLKNALCIFNSRPLSCKFC